MFYNRTQLDLFYTRTQQDLLYNFAALASSLALSARNYRPSSPGRAKYLSLLARGEAGRRQVLLEQARRSAPEDPEGCFNLAVFRWQVPAHPSRQRRQNRVCGGGMLLSGRGRDQYHGMLE